MNNWKRIAVAAMAAVASLGMAACNLVAVDKDKDMEQVVAKVNGDPIYKQEYTDAYNNAMMNMSIQYQMMGMQMPSDEETLKTMRDNALESLITQKLMIQKCDELKIELTEDEKKEIDAKVEEDFKGFYDSIREQVKSELGEEAADADIEKRTNEEAQAQLDEMKLTKEKYRDSLIDMKRMDKLTEQVESEAKATDEDVKKYYDDKLKEQQDAIAADVTAFNNYHNAGDELVIPEGCFYVKHVLVKVDDETTTKITDIRTEQQGYSDEMSKLIMEDKTANQAKIDELEAKNNDCKKRIDDATATFKTKADEVLAKAKAGEDFDKLIEQYGEDPGSKEEPQKTSGYFIGPKAIGYDANFGAAALKLTKVGDISDVVMSAPDSGYTGYHILKRVSDVPARTVPFEEVKEKFTEAVLTQKKNEIFEQRKTEWSQAAKIEKFEDALKDNSDQYEENK